MRAAASFLGVSPSTLRNWDRVGKLKAIRHPINQYRLYSKVELQRLLYRMRPKLHRSRSGPRRTFENERQVRVGGQLQRPPRAGYGPFLHA
ncbi:MAG: MerR family DNA-binding transcriptional regulator [Terriglobia bacterium]